ncbi:unnamed protein product, partial [Strongylus vulgaris]
EGALLQLINDIHDTTRKIASNSWFYATSDEQDSVSERRNWTERISEALSYLTTRMSREEEAELRESRALPKLIQRAVIQKSSFQDGTVANLASAVESFTPSVVHMEDDFTEEQQECANKKTKCKRSRIYSGAASVNYADDASDSACLENDNYADIEEEIQSTAAKGPNDANHSEEAEPSGAKNKLLPDHMDEPPKKQKKIKLEQDVKIEETEQEYFTKSTQHNSVALKDRFKIADPKTLVRSEDVIFARRKPFARRLITEYKFENFIKPGLLHKGRYPRLYYESGDQDNRADSVFIGILRKSTDMDKKCNKGSDSCATEVDVYDEWLATFGGFRVLFEEENVQDDGDGEDNGPEFQGRGLSDIEMEGTQCHDSSHCGFDDSSASFFSNGISTRRDRFNDIRPDEYKAIGIDVKNIVPNKDFYSMTKEERAAAVAAEFEAIDALGPKKEDGYVINYGLLVPCKFLSSEHCKDEACDEVNLVQSSG